MEAVTNLFNLGSCGILLVQFIYSRSQSIKVKEGIFSVVNTNSNRLVQGFKTLIANCGNLIIDVGTGDLNALKPILE
jgi:hypothetical protein